jgi:hypothetical protein
MKILASLCTLALAGGTAHAQFYKLHNVDIGGGAIGQTPTTLTTQTTPVIQTNTNSFGGLFSLKEHPVSWAGVEFNYAYTEMSEQYFAPTYHARTKTDMHEATAAYLFHANVRHIQTFLSVGGGAVDFVPFTGQNQWRGAGLVELGFDIPTRNPHFGFRAMGRELIYRDPNYKQPNLGSKQWVGLTEPSLGVWYRF